jgi:hypothetical protein
MAKQVCTIALLFISFILKAQVTIINYQYELDVFRFSTEIVGDLILQNDSTTPSFDRITDLSPLENIEKMGGSFVLRNTLVSTLSPMKSLHYIKNGVGFYDNTELEDIGVLNGIPLNYLTMTNCTKLNFNNLDSIISPRIDISGLHGLISFTKSMNNNFNLFFRIHNCNNLEDLTLAFNDTSANINIVENIKLKNIHFEFAQKILQAPTNVNEFFMLRKVVHILDNSTLTEITADNNDVGYLRFYIRNNPTLSEFCVFEKSYRLFHQYQSAELSNWSDISTLYINANAAPFSSYMQVINNKDCSHITNVNEQNILTEKPSIYPNPNNGQQLNLSGVKVGSRIKIYDVTGKEVFNTIYTTTATVDLPNITKGLYFLELRSLNEPTQVLKFVVN